MTLQFRQAVAADAAAIAALVNAAYRGASSRRGWTSEADLLAGLRTETAEVLKLLHATDRCFLLCLESAALLGCICLERHGETAHLGMFAVQPDRQGRGVGKQLLDYAERQAVAAWHARRAAMVVITWREELLAYYQRRGYRRTGMCIPFPMQSALWTPLVGELQLELLEKCLQALPDIQE